MLGNEIVSFLDQNGQMKNASLCSQMQENIKEIEEV